MCKYEMDPTSIVEDTERTRFGLQTDGRTDKVKPLYPPSTSSAEYKMVIRCEIKCPNYIFQSMICPESGRITGAAAWVILF